MSIVQISAALGPAECELAVKLTLQEILKDAKKHQISFDILEENSTKYGYSSVLQACRASGAGGQHVNTTDSAIHAIHVATGISVKVMSERSQHANKKIAKELLAMKIQQQLDAQHESQKNKQHQQHALIERGSAIRQFKY